MQQNYLETTKNVYKEAAENPGWFVLYDNTCMATSRIKNSKENA